VNYGIRRAAPHPDDAVVVQETGCGVQPMRASRLSVILGRLATVIPLLRSSTLPPLLFALRVARIQVASSRASGSSTHSGTAVPSSWHTSSSAAPRQLSQASSCLRLNSLNDPHYALLPGLALPDALPDAGAPKMGLLSRGQIRRACWAP